MKLCSACLLGVKCRYDGRDKLNDKVIALSKKEILVPVCPEQLGGLPTPRPATERVGNKVLTSDGLDVTQQFINGAEETLRIARMLGCKEAILYDKSPSCGTTRIYDGTFSNQLKAGIGVTAELLKKNGIKVMVADSLQ